MRILLVEDDRRVAAAIGKHLKAAGYSYDIAADGMDGEEMASVNDYDVIVLDIMLPKQDGWTTCTRLRKADVRTPILMLTALDDVDNRVRGLDCGADDYLAKPFHFNELLARLRSLARRGGDVRGVVIERHGLRLDINAHRAFRDGREIALTTKEFALLELFMSRPDTVLSRELISEHLWGMDYEQKSNVIESFVKFLRQKIDRGHDKPLIHTIRGSGYMFSGRKP